MTARAEPAVNVAKKTRVKAVFFDDANSTTTEHRRVFSRDIELAVAQDHLRLVYQPNFDLRTDHIVGAEALIRWDHPVRGEVLPAAFIPFAEKGRFIGSISRWVLSRVVEDMLTARALPPGFRIFFNLSVWDLDDVSFLNALSATLAEHRHMADLLGVEITETTAMQNVKQSLETLGRIRKLGVRVAIDDFGTGYSSLSYLKLLPVDLVKIDRSFVSGLPSDRRDGDLVETMIDICGRFAISSLAEGIETEGQRAWLREHGCNFGQGYLFDRPLSFEMLLARLSQRSV